MKPFLIVLSAALVGLGCQTTRHRGVSETASATSSTCGIGGSSSLDSTRCLSKAQLEGVSECVLSVAEEIVSGIPENPPLGARSGIWDVTTGGEYSANACFGIILKKFPGAQLLSVIDNGQDLRMLSISQSLATQMSGLLKQSQLEGVTDCVSKVFPELSISLDGSSHLTGDWQVEVTGANSAIGCFNYIRSKLPGAQLLGAIDDFQGLAVLFISGKTRVEASTGSSGPALNGSYAFFLKEGSSFDLCVSSASSLPGASLKRAFPTFRMFYLNLANVSEGLLQSLPCIKSWEKEGTAQISEQPRKYIAGTLLDPNPEASTNACAEKVRSVPGVQVTRVLSQSFTIAFTGALGTDEKVRQLPCVTFVEEEIITSPSTSFVSVKTQLEAVACVKLAESIAISSIPEIPAPSGPSGSWSVTVRNGYGFSRCANDVKTAIPGVQVTIIRHAGLVVTESGH